ncbi:MAG: hypothetical protein KJ556_09665 [Gammaproteobacteria bacterium]|nr:hypothetical protein [Gammaproteobacteria bacterium]MBU2059838.1 hypothetical protein [Gammaproteobacteria bacterium]MBU2175381.1 hypothetical protein [Gammaproteobacteria bacterium]MBU2245711.1 hypothetical protein [Gammaproteobacteria bacterium]MBU2345115.1 hypothetical protein [Gammaproteobacteria bacterium]
MPNLIKEYPKNLELVNPSDYEQLASYKFVHITTGAAFEYSLSVPISGYPKVNYSGALLIWHFPYPQIEEQWVTDSIKDLAQTHTAESLFDELDNLVGLQEQHKELIGNICFEDYPHLPVPDNSAVQIRSAYIIPEFQQYRIATQAYRFIALHKNLVVSDNNQTPYAQKLWGNTLPQYGRVSIFNQLLMKYIGQVDPELEIDFTVWGIVSSNENYLAIKQGAVEAGVGGYKVDQDCHDVLLVFKPKSDKDA